MAGLTRRIADFAAGLSLAHVPEPVRAKARLHVLDTLGCGIAGADSTLARQALEFLALEHRAGDCLVAGTTQRYPPAAAAFANAMAMNALDFDDGFEVEGKGMGHPGCSILAAALSACGGARIDGAAFLAAIIAGYEANNRLIHAMQPSHERFRQVYGVGQHQSVGAAIAFGRLAGLDAEAMENTIGLAATLAHVPSLHKYNWDRRPLVSFKDFCAPAAEAGVRAVQMHRCGLIGAKAVLDGETGLWRMLGSDRFDAALLVDGLGERWTLPGNSIKPYPTCRWMHAALEAFERVMLAHGLEADAIARVVIRGSAGMVRDFMDRAPATMVDAQFSLPFALAALALRRAPAAAWYREAALRDPAMLRFAARVEAELDPEVDALMSGPERRPAGRVLVMARGGNYDSGLIAGPRGGSSRPLPEADLHDKFLANASSVLGEGRAASLGRRIMMLEAEQDMAGLLGICTPLDREF